MLPKYSPEAMRNNFIHLIGCVRFDTRSCILHGFSQQTSNASCGMRRCPMRLRYGLWRKGRWEKHPTTYTYSTEPCPNPIPSKKESFKKSQFETFIERIEDFIGTLTLPIVLFTLVDFTQVVHEKWAPSFLTSVLNSTR